ncbi:MAG: hypothetical protein MZV70_75070 [Desulfobacterales bacterium]|nr:hypothetical protein [Desulfobacterales bacterium]
MKHSRILLIVAALVLLGSWAVAGPCGGWGPGMGPGYGMAPGGVSTLDLTLGTDPENPGAASELSHRGHPLQNQMFSKRAELRMLWAQAAPNQGKIAAKQQRGSGAGKPAARESHPASVRYAQHPDSRAAGPNARHGPRHGAR